MINYRYLRIAVFAMIMIFLLLLSWQNNFLFGKQLASASSVMCLAMMHKLIQHGKNKGNSDGRNSNALKNSHKGEFKIYRNLDE